MGGQSSKQALLRAASGRGDNETVISMLEEGARYAEQHPEADDHLRVNDKDEVNIHTNNRL